MHRLSNVRIHDERHEIDSVRRSHIINQNDRSRGMQILQQAQGYYMAMERYRRNRERYKRYTKGNQWGDIITVDGERMTEEEYIKRQGNVPLQNNLIGRTVRNVIGEYSKQNTEPTCVARDRDEQQLAETVSTLLQYNMQVNRMQEMNSKAFWEFLVGGMPVQRKTYSWNTATQRMDNWTYNVSPNNFIVDNNMRDIRMWDCSFVGEIHDLDFGQVCSLAGNPMEYQRLAEIYRTARDANSLNHLWTDFGYGQDYFSQDFLMPTDNTRCRVIEVWRKEQKPRYRCHDYLKGKIFKVDECDYAAMVLAENQKRLEMGQRNGIPADEIPFIEAEWFVDDYWYYYFLSPCGDILSEGETPYKHKSHPYVFKAYPFIDGEINPFVADFIDQQRYINRLLILQDFIIRASGKGALLVPEDCLGNMKPQNFADAWTKFNGVIVYKPGKSGQVPKQVSANSTNIGLHELLNLELKLFEDISGVNSALQGKASFAGESGSHAQVMAQNAATSLVDLFNSFNEFVREGAYKDVKNIQQFYTEKDIYNIVGKSGTDISRISDVEVDLSMAQSQATPAYREAANNILLELYRAQAISVEQLLENGNFPFADQLLQSIKSQKQQIEQGQMPEGISPELLQQAQQGADMDAVNQLQNAMRA